MGIDEQYSHGIDAWAWIFRQTHPPVRFKTPFSSARERSFRRRPERLLRLSSRYHYIRHVNDRNSSNELAKNPITEVNKSFIYERIDGSTQVRILELFPGNENSPLEGRLVAEPVGALSSFSAVSYCWGSPEAADIIRIGGIDLHITKNLSMLLRHLRSTKDKRRFWIDAICIAQHMRKERHDQVGIMGQLYSEATKVIIWLGDEGEETADAFSVIEDAYDAYLKSQAHNGPMVTLLSLQQDGFPPQDDKRWPALRSLLDSNWFSRTWIVQECCLARSAVMTCGSFSYNWASFAKLALVMHQTEAHRVFNVQSIIQASRIALISNFITGYEKYSLLDLAKLAVGLSATDPRDKIYGLLGISTDANAFKSSVDYEKSVPTVYVDAVEVFLHQGRLDFLNLAGDAALSDQQGLPSWVPDFSIDARAEQLRYDTFPWWVPDSSTDAPAEQQRSREDRLRQLYLWNHKPPTISADRRVLSIFCIAKHSVKAIGCHLPLGLARQDIADLRQRLEQWRHLAMEKRRYPSGIDPFEAFARTLITLDDWTPSTKFTSASDLYTATRSHLRGFRRGTLPESKEYDLRLLEISRYLDTMYMRCSKRSFFVTKDGYMGLGPLFLQPGDLVVEIDGTMTPFVVRQVKGGQYKLVGECFVHAERRTVTPELHDLQEIQLI